MNYNPKETLAEHWAKRGIYMPVAEEVKPEPEVEVEVKSEETPAPKKKKASKEEEEK